MIPVRKLPTVLADRVADLAASSRRRLVTVALMARAVFAAQAPLIVATNADDGDLNDTWLLVLGASAAVVTMLVSARLIGSRRERDTSPWIPIVDIGLAALINLLAAKVITEGTFWEPRRDVFAAYAAGTLATWVLARTAVDASRPLAWPLAGIGGIIALQFGMALVNGDSVANSVPWPIVVTRSVTGATWLLLASFLSWLVRLHERDLTFIAHQLGVDAGRQGAREATHDVALRGVRQIEQDLMVWANQSAAPDADRVALRDAASEVVRQLEAALEGRYDVPDGLHAHLRTIGATSGLIDVAIPPNEQVLEAPERLALCGAAEAAIDNALRHAGGSRVLVTATNLDAEIEVEVRDFGPGFDFDENHQRTQRAGRGIAGSIIGRVENVGGSAVFTIPESGGSRWTLTVPLGQQPLEPASPARAVALAGAVAVVLLVGGVIVLR